MPTFPPGAAWFALAGAAAAAVPIVLHLLNRRRVRVLRWAAMDFLRESIHRSRRLIRLRDVVLMALRAAALVLLGLALARPYFSWSGGAGSAGQPVHAVMLVDNSLSMSSAGVAGTLLDEAKTAAKGLLDRLPGGSAVSVMPLCGGPAGGVPEPRGSRDDAREAVDLIEVVDRKAVAGESAALAAEAAGTGPPGLARRVVIFGDQQAVNWPAGAAGAWKPLGDFQAVRLGPPERDNTWVAEFEPQDPVASPAASTLFRAVIEHAGKARTGVEATLIVDGRAVDSRTVDLEPGQRRELDFEHRFTAQVAAGEVVEVPVSIMLSPDRLPADDERHVVVPVVAALPVVFIDQLGSEERPRLGRVGETYLLRRLLAPVESRSDPAPQLVQVEHLAAADVTAERLAAARMVVVAGVDDPAGMVPVLREYVEQGGELVVAAGGSFDPAAWNRAAWLDGAGILPLPLAPRPVGATLAEATETVDPLQLDAGQLAAGMLPPNLPLDEAKPICERPLFFKVVEAVDDEPTRSALQSAEIKRLEAGIEADIRREESAARAASPDDGRAATAVPARPEWLAWNQPRRGDPLRQRPARDETVAKVAARLAEGARPRVLARFGNGLPWVVERPVGRGRLTLVTSGVLGNWASGWNTLGLGADALLYDRLLRGRLEATLPLRTIEPRDDVSVAIPANLRQLRWSLERPGGGKTELEPTFIDASTVGLGCGPLLTRGVYTIRGVEEEAADAAVAARIVLAVNGPADESNLRQVDGESFAAAVEGGQAALLGPQQEISLEGTRVFGHWLWKPLLLAVIALLVAERAVVAAAASRVAAEGGGAALAGSPAGVSA